MLIIREAQAEDLPAAREIFREYADEGDRGICLENFKEEVESLPGLYAPPRGAILLAMDQDAVVGCVAIRPFDEAAVEMKRLFVRPSHRSRGVGRRLVEAVINLASVRGNQELVLDTLDSMVEAQGLYRSLGFEPCEPFKKDAPKEIHFFRLKLSG